MVIWLPMSTIAFRKAPWNDTEVICEQPKVIPGRMVCSGEKRGDEFDFKPYERTGEKVFEEIFCATSCSSGPTVSKYSRSAA